MKATQMSLPAVEGRDGEGFSLTTSFEALPLVCVDVETTGLTPDKGARVCEIALLRSAGEREVARFESLVHPQQPMPPEVIAVHGITDAMVAEAPVFTALLPDIRDLLQGAVVVGHNVHFDLRFLRHEWRIAGDALPECVAIDTLSLARTYFDFSRNGLGAIAAALGIAHTAAHRAMVTALQDALPESAPLCMRYRAWHAPETVRVVQPLSVYFQRGYGFLHAFCHLRREERHFRLDRIIELKPVTDD